MSQICHRLGAVDSGRNAEDETSRKKGATTDGAKCETEKRGILGI